jgi:hypothetical protein
VEVYCSGSEVEGVSASALELSDELSDFSSFLGAAGALDSPPASSTLNFSKAEMSVPSSTRIAIGYTRSS